MGKLYSPGSSRFSGGDKGSSPIGIRNGVNGQAEAADQERDASEKRCEGLALELWELEKRIMDSQRRLLQHTAGILQMTHKGPIKVGKTNGGGQNGIGGIPGSPESMYTYNNARGSIDVSAEAGDLFDERSLYRTFEKLDGLSFGRNSWDSGRPNAGGDSGLDAIARTEQKLEDLNHCLRDIIIKASPDGASNYSLPPHAKDEQMSGPPGTLMTSQLEYLEEGIKAMKASSDHAKIKGYQSDKQTKTDGMMEETLEGLNIEIHNVLSPIEPSHPEPPQLTGVGVSSQIDYLQSSLSIIHRELRESSKSRSGGLNAPDEYETTLTGLWDVIQAGEEEVRQRALRSKLARANSGHAEDDEDDEDLDGTLETFSLQAFSVKIRSLFSQAMSLKEKKKVLQRQIKQQRELNSKDNSELSTRLEETEAAAEEAENQSRELKGQLTVLMQQLEESRQASTQRGHEQAQREEEESLVKELQQKLATSNDALAHLEDELQEMRDDREIGNAETQSRLTDAQAKVDGLQFKLAEALKASRLVEQKEQELEERNIQIAMLTTEVTIARAELDGAYGSRAQRAAEVAANPAIQKEIDDLTNQNKTLVAELNELKIKLEASAGGGANSSRVQQLQKELGETIEEYEVMTKQSIEWEKEREGLEREIDKLRDERESLEAKLSDEQVRWLGMKSPGLPGEASPGIGAGSTSTMVLKNEFKKMMRDTRAEGQRLYGYVQCCDFFIQDWSVIVQQG